MIVWLVRKASGNYLERVTKGESVLEILKERYAKGEISKKEYEKINKDIS